MFVSVLGPLCSIPISALSHPYTLCMPTNMSRNCRLKFSRSACMQWICLQSVTHGDVAHHLKWCKAIPLPLSNLSQCQNPISSLHMRGFIWKQTCLSLHKCYGSSYGFIYPETQLFGCMLYNMLYTPWFEKLPLSKICSHQRLERSNTKYFRHTNIQYCKLLNVSRLFVVFLVLQNFFTQKFTHNNFWAKLFRIMLSVFPSTCKLALAKKCCLLPTSLANEILVNAENMLVRIMTESSYMLSLCRGKAIYDFALWWG